MAWENYFDSKSVDFIVQSIKYYIWKFNTCTFFRFDCFSIIKTISKVLDEIVPANNVTQDFKIRRFTLFLVIIKIFLMKNS